MTGDRAESCCTSASMRYTEFMTNPIKHWTLRVGDLMSPRAAKIGQVLDTIKAAQQHLVGHPPAQELGGKCCKCGGTGWYTRSNGGQDRCSGPRNGECVGGRSVKRASLKAGRDYAAAVNARCNELKVAAKAAFPTT